MVKVDVRGDYLNIESTKDGDLGEITAEGDYVEMDDKFHVGKKRKVLNLPVLVNSKAMIWSPNMKQLKLLVSAWGEESKAWVGKKFQIFHIEDNLLIKPL